jgi:hypothetical protein
MCMITLMKETAFYSETSIHIDQITRPNISDEIYLEREKKMFEFSNEDKLFTV